MKRAPFFLLPLAILAACSTPGAEYAAKHPELTPEQRKVLSAGTLHNGDAVAGLTKDQVRVAMGRDPDQFTTFNGEEAWVWARRKARGYDGGNSTMTSMAADHTRDPGSDADAPATVQEKTTVYFQSGRAVRVVVEDTNDTR